MIQVSIKMICSIFMSSNNFFLGFFFFTYIKMSKNSSAKYHLNNKERLQKKSQERYQSFSKEKKKKAIWLRMIQKCTRRWKTKACWV